METLKVNKRVSFDDITSLIVKVCFKRALRHKESLLISQEAFFVDILEKRSKMSQADKPNQVE
jgi:hypothetical protein